MLDHRLIVQETQASAKIAQTTCAVEMVDAVEGKEAEEEVVIEVEMLTAEGIIGESPQRAFEIRDQGRLQTQLGACRRQLAQLQAQLKRPPRHRHHQQHLQHRLRLSQEDRLPQNRSRIQLRMITRTSLQRDFIPGQPPGARK